MWTFQREHIVNENVGKSGLNQIAVFAVSGALIIAMNQPMNQPTAVAQLQLY